MAQIILFDGECNFCNGSVQFIIKRDPKAYFSFASLQSEVGKSLSRDFSLADHGDSFILIEDEHVYSKSTAALRVAKKLSHLWRFFYVFIFVPRPIRDAIYHVIAKNRYHFFGKSETCFLPTPEIRKRFL